MEILAGYENLKKTVKDLPDLEVLLKDINRRLPNAPVLVINAQGDELEYGARFNFLVGGNILGRGLTIEDLFVTYYLRQAKVTQMDTMLQHARMYGYRQKIMPYSRVYLPSALADRFAAIHQSEEALRELLVDGNSVKQVPIRVIGSLRATRLGILDVNTIAAYRAGQQVYPVDVVHEPSKLNGSVEVLDRMVDAACGGTRIDKEYIKVPLDTIMEMVKTVVVQPDDGDWEPEAIIKVLESISGQYSHGYLFVRDLNRKDTYLPHGSIRGSNQRDARNLGVPTLFMFKEGGKPDSPFKSRIWHPTVVFPVDMDIMVFNRTTAANVAN